MNIIKRYIIKVIDEHFKNAITNLGKTMLQVDTLEKKGEQLERQVQRLIELSPEFIDRINAITEYLKIEYKIIQVPVPDILRGKLLIPTKNKLIAIKIRKEVTNENKKNNSF